MQGDSPSVRLPAGYRYGDLDGRQTIVCKTCGRRWWADRMRHWANEVYLIEHRDDHQRLRRKLPRNLPGSTRSQLPRQDAGQT